MLRLRSFLSKSHRKQLRFYAQLATNGNEKGKTDYFIVLRPKNAETTRNFQQKTFSPEDFHLLKRYLESRIELSPSYQPNNLTTTNNYPHPDPCFSKEDVKPKRKRSTNLAPKSYSLISTAEDVVLNVYGGDLRGKNDTVFCLFNPGENSKLPEKFIEANARKILIFENTKSGADKWRAFKRKNDEIVLGVEQINFPSLCNISMSDTRKEKPNSFVELLKKYEIAVDKHDSNAARPKELGPPVTFIGALPFYKERGFFVELIHSRSQSNNLFKFGAVDFLLYLSPSKYLVLANDADCPYIHSSARNRRNFYNLLFNVSLKAKVPFLNNFEPRVTYAESNVVYKPQLIKAGLSPDEACLVHIQTKRNDEIPLVKRLSETSADDFHVYLHFDYFNRQLYLYKDKTTDFLRNWFPGAEKHLKEKQINFFDKKCKQLNFEEELSLFNALNEWPALEESPFWKEAENYVSTVVYPFADD